MERHNPGRRRTADHLYASALSLARTGETFDRLRGLQGVEGEALLLVLEASRADGRSGVTESEPITPGRLGRELRLPSASVTALVDRLERGGHLRRVRDTGDRRKVLLLPTEEAERAHTTYWGGLDERIVEVMERFSPEELSIVDRFLRGATAVTEGYRAEREGHP